MGKKKRIAKEPYYQRVREIKLPFRIKILTQSQTPEPTHVPIEEAEELKVTILRIEKENEELRLNLNQVTFERNEIRFNLD